MRFAIFTMCEPDQASQLASLSDQTASAGAGVAIRQSYVFQGIPFPSGVGDQQMVTMTIVETDSNEALGAFLYARNSRGVVTWSVPLYELKPGKVGAQLVKAQGGAPSKSK